MTYVLLAIVAVLAALAFLLLTWWGAAIVLVLGAILVLYVSAARKGDLSVGTVESGPREPTGTTRSATGGVETANQRVGQE
jgi:predicted secreted protein